MMHPDVKKFFGNRVLKIRSVVFANAWIPEQDVITWWSGNLTVYEYESGEVKYYYKGGLTSEKEILRMIKLKAFL